MLSYEISWNKPVIMKAINGWKMINTTNLLAAIITFAFTASVFGQSLWFRH